MGGRGGKSVRTLWLVIIYGVPMLFIFHWAVTTISQHVHNTVARLVALLHGTFFLMLAAVFAIQILPIRDAPTITIFGIGTLGVLLAAFGVHLHLKLSGWSDRWPPLLEVLAAYVWLIPGLWTLASGRNLFNVVQFVRRGIWVVPIYTFRFHVAMWIASALVAGFVLALYQPYRRGRNAGRAMGTLSGLLWGVGGLDACLWLFGALLPARLPNWVPPFPYLVGMLIWLVMVRRAIVRYELVPSQLQQYRDLFTLSPVPVVIVDRVGKIVSRNPAAVSLLGSRQQSWADICARVGPGEWTRYRNAWARQIPIRAWELDIADAEGQSRTIVVDGQYLALGERVHSILALHDHTAYKLESRALVRLVDQDPLTGVANRRAFEEKVREAIEDDDSDWKQFAVFFVDLDEFKQLNDGWGHLAGDEALRETARRLLSGMRPVDMVARFGGDEFTLLVSNIRSLDEATVVRDRIVQRCQAPIVIAEDRMISVAVSVGFSRYPHDGADLATLLDAADRAMYRIKRIRQS